MDEGSPVGCLFFREKIVVLGILLLLATFGAASFANKHKKVQSQAKTIKIRCIGECEGDCVLELPSGVQVVDLLARLKLTPDADSSKLVLEERLKRDQIFIIPKKGGMSLYVTGAVAESGLLFVPESLRFNQLKEYLILANDADIGVFGRRRRLLCEGETIHIPAKSDFIARK